MSPEVNLDATVVGIQFNAALSVLADITTRRAYIGGSGVHIDRNEIEAMRLGLVDRTKSFNLAQKFSLVESVLEFLRLYQGIANVSQEEFTDILIDDKGLSGKAMWGAGLREKYRGRYSSYSTNKDNFLWRLAGFGRSEAAQGAWQNVEAALAGQALS